ncbi:MAG TPA: hypothetical protein VK766_02930, partial [Cytophagaceae bacterium]|nr:hypothetical protein [Cytophagaceae bacterium]
MLKYFNKIKKIRAKLLIQFGILIVLSVFLMGVMLYSIHRISNYTNLRRTTQELNIALLKMRK